MSERDRVIAAYEKWQGGCLADALTQDERSDWKIGLADFHAGWQAAKEQDDPPVEEKETEQDMYSWCKAFRSDCIKAKREVGLNTRTLSRVYQAAAVKSNKWTRLDDGDYELTDIKPYIPDREAFAPYNKLLTFDAWMRALANDEISKDLVCSIRGVGDVSYRLLIEGAKKYIQSKGE